MKLIVLFGVLVASVCTASSQRIILPTYRPDIGRPTIILPTYRPPVSKPVTRWVREAHDKPLWLYEGDVPRAPASGDHPFLPSRIDDVKLDPNRRYARSLDSPSAKRGGGGRTSSGSRDTGPTHPGSNRRNARSIRLPDPLEPFWPSPTIPKPVDPFNPRDLPTRGPYPIYARATREVHLPGVKEPTHRDVIIPNWNPNAKVNPWQRIGVKSRN